MDKHKGVKIPVQLRVNMWLGLSAHEKKFNSFSEGNFSVYAEMVMWLDKYSDTYHFLIDGGACDVLLSICSMKTRLRCSRSGEPLVWLVAISFQT